MLDGFRVASKGIEHDIVDRTACQPLDDHAAFHEDLCGWVDEAAENDLPFDREVGEHLLRHLRDDREYGSRLWRAAGIVRAIEQRALVEIHTVLAHGIEEGRVQAHMTGEGDRRMVLHGSAVTHHLDRVEQHRHLVALPRGHAHHQESSATPLMRFLALWSSSTRSVRRAAARMPLSRNSECNGALPLANSCEMPEGCAWVRSSLALSWFTSSNGEAMRLALYSSRQWRNLSMEPLVGAFVSGVSVFDIELTSPSPCDSLRILRSC